MRTKADRMPRSILREEKLAYPYASGRLHDMASTASTTIALANLTPAGGQAVTPAHSTASQIASHSTPSLSNQQHSSTAQSTGTGSSTNHPQPPNAGTGQTRSAALISRAAILDFLVHTWLGNIIASLTLLLTLPGLALAAWSGAVQLIYARWCARNDALQSCFAAAAMNKFSEYCNKTMAVGVLQPPKEKRAVTDPAQSLWKWTLMLLALDVVDFTAMMTVTLAAGVLAVVLCRPYMISRRREISAVRLEYYSTVRGLRPCCKSTAIKILEHVRELELSGGVWPPAECDPLLGDAEPPEEEKPIFAEEMHINSFHLSQSSDEEQTEEEEEEESDRNSDSEVGSDDSWLDDTPIDEDDMELFITLSSMDADVSFSMKALWMSLQSDNDPRQISLKEWRAFHVARSRTFKYPACVLRHATLRITGESYEHAAPELIPVCRDVLREFVINGELSNKVVIKRVISHRRVVDPLPEVTLLAITEDKPFGKPPAASVDFPLLNPQKRDWVTIEIGLTLELHDKSKTVSKRQLDKMLLKLTSRPPDTDPYSAIRAASRFRRVRQRILWESSRRAET